MRFRKAVTAGRLAAVALGLLIAAATVVLWRRLAGALLHPLEPGMLLGAGISAAAAAAAVHLGWPLSAARRWGVWPDRAIIVSTSLAVGGLVVGLWLPGTSLPPMLAVVAVLLVEAVGVWLWRSRRYALPKPQATRQDAASGNDLIHRGERRPKPSPARGHPAAYARADGGRIRGVAGLAAGAAGRRATDGKRPRGLLPSAGRDPRVARRADRRTGIATERPGNCFPTAPGSTCGWPRPRLSPPRWSWSS